MCSTEAAFLFHGRRMRLACRPSLLSTVSKTTTVVTQLKAHYSRRRRPVLRPRSSPLRRPLWALRLPSHRAQSNQDEGAASPRVEASPSADRMHRVPQSKPAGRVQDRVRRVRHRDREQEVRSDSLLLCHKPTSQRHNVDVIARLEDEAQQVLERTNFFHSGGHPAAYAYLADEGQVSRSYGCTSDRGASLPPYRSTMLLQSGVCRTNCIDCLE
jgi:hypothetical protein